MAMGKRKAKQQGLWVSTDEERPVCNDQNESCWQKNRRAHMTQN